MGEVGAAGVDSCFEKYLLYWFIFLIQITFFVINLISIWVNFSQFHLFSLIIQSCDQFPEYWE